jgi:hypothetical protein
VLLAPQFRRLYRALRREWVIWHLRYLIRRGTRAQRRSAAKLQQRKAQ